MVSVPLRQAFLSRERMLLTIAVIDSPTMIEVIGLAGFDGVIFDMEHGPFTTASVSKCIVAAERRGLAPLVRLPFARREEIGALLDLGIAGLIVPHVQSAQMAREVVERCRFKPTGDRGGNGWVRAAAFSGDPSYFRSEDDRVAVIVQIEGAEGLSSAASIIGTEGVDAVFVGPVDLSHALGVPNELEHPLIVDAVHTVCELAHDSGKSVCVFSATTGQVANWRSRGVDTAIFGVDANLALRGLTASLQEIHSDPNGGK
mgnify:CR=1 FL=1